MLVCFCDYTELYTNKKGLVLELPEQNHYTFNPYPV